jgi:hypothetical protein
MLKKDNHYILLIAIVISLLAGKYAVAQDDIVVFDPNYIIGDQEILDSGSMTLEEVKQFLAAKNGYLANYRIAACTDDDVLNQRPCTGPVKSAAEIIYDRAQVNKVNPKFILVLLQKEQSLVEDASPTQSSLDWAVGYGCFDNQACNERWRGFWKQVNSATLQFRDYMDNPQLYNYKTGNTYTVTNTNREPMVVTPVNQATAALYNYTPHVYNGNYNFFKLWQRYFSRFRPYPNGTLLQVKGETGVWLIQDGKKRPFTSKGALTTRYDLNKIVIASKSDLDGYEKGAPIKFPQYALVRSPRGTIFLIVGDSRRGFASTKAFKNTGFNPEEVENASWEDINAFKEGTPITATTTYATGSLLQNKKTGGVYFVMDGKKAPILDAIFLKTKFKAYKMAKTDPKKLEAFKTVDPVVFDDGELLSSSLSSAVYVVADGKKLPITSGAVFEKLGYSWNNIISVPPKVLYLYPEGPALSEANVKIGSSSSQTITDTATSTATSTVAIMNN